MIPGPAKARIYEVGPRDGLQNEKAFLPPEAKAAFVTRLAEAGLKDIEIGAFVRPDKVPQMAGTDDLARLLPRTSGAPWPGVTRWALVPNAKGARRAAACGIRAWGVFTATSETFARKNMDCAIAESLDRIREVMSLAAKEGARVRGYVSTAFGCPYEGAVPPAKVAEAAKALLDAGVEEVSVSDTLGVATPRQVEEVFAELLRLAPAGRFAGHFHDTRGTALANVCAAIRVGVATFDASAGGLGGCPYAPGASGNLATEDLAYLLEGMGIATGVDLARLCAASPPLEPLLGRTLPGKCLQAQRAC